MFNNKRIYFKTHPSLWPRIWGGEEYITEVVLEVGWLFSNSDFNTGIESNDKICLNVNALFERDVFSETSSNVRLFQGQS